MTPTEYVIKDNIKGDIVISGIRNSGVDGRFFSITLGDICTYLGNKKKCMFCIKCLARDREYYGYITYDDLSGCFYPAGQPNFNKTSVHFLSAWGENLAYNHYYCGIVIRLDNDRVNFYDLAYYGYKLEYDFPKELLNHELCPCLFTSMVKVPDTKG